MKTPDLQAFLETFATKTKDLVGSQDILAQKRRFIEGTKPVVIALRARGVNEADIVKRLREAAAEQDFDLGEKLIKEVFAAWDAKPRKAAKLPKPRVAPKAAPLPPPISPAIR